MGETAPPAIGAPAAISVKDDLSAFDSGKPPLTDWLKQRALKAEGKSARSFVIACEGKAIGYYTLAAGSVSHAHANARLRRNMPDPIPVIVLARLAIDVGFQGKGIGGALLRDALLRAAQAARTIGAAALLVHAIDEEAKAFYLKYGFREFPSDASTLFLSLETIVEAL